MDERLRAELIARRDEDQRVRGVTFRPSARGSAGAPDEAARERQRVDEGNTVWLGRLVAGVGWPGRSMVGEDGAHAAWLLAQHADLLPRMQRVFLDALSAAVVEGEASPTDLAYLEDRVRLNAGMYQIYGTQFTVGANGIGPHPIDDLHSLDERRAAVGLEPFADYEARMRAR